MQERSQYNSKIKYCPGTEGGKPAAPRRGAGDVPTAGDKRLTRNVGILLSKERYWAIPGTEEIKLEVLETTEFQENGEGEIQRASDVDKKSRTSKETWTKEEKE